MKRTAFKISQIALMVCLISVCAQFTVPLGGVPMTLQTFMIALCGYMLGPIKGMLSVLIYLALGTVGLPVFTGFGASFAWLIGPTGGFLFGFLPFVFLCGLGKGKSFPVFTSLALFGLFLCHGMGVLWFSAVTANPLFSSFLFTSLPYLLKDILSVIFAKILTDKIRQRAPSLFLFRDAS